MQLQISFDALFDPRNGVDASLFDEFKRRLEAHQMHHKRVPRTHLHLTRHRSERQKNIELNLLRVCTPHPIIFYTIAV